MHSNGHWKQAVAGKVERHVKRELKRLARAKRQTISRYIGAVLTAHVDRQATNGHPTPKR